MTGFCIILRGYESREILYLDMIFIEDMRLGLGMERKIGNLLGDCLLWLPSFLLPAGNLEWTAVRMGRISFGNGNASKCECECTQ